MATKKLASIKGRRMRLTRLDECGVPVIGSDIFPSGETVRIPPARIVTSMLPEGRKAKAHGLTRPLATVSTWNF